MKRFCLLNAALLTVALVGVMAAVNPPHESVSLDVNHPVHVGSTVLPAGHYTIVSQNEPGGAPQLLIQGKNGSAETLAKTISNKASVTAPTATKIELQKIGSDYYLSKVWMKGRKYGWNIPLPENVSNQQGQTVEISGSYQAGQQGQNSANPAVHNQPMTIPQDSHAQ